MLIVYKMYDIVKLYYTCKNLIQQYYSKVLEENIAYYMSEGNTNNSHNSIVDLISLLLASITFDQNIQEAKMHQQSFQLLEIVNVKAKLRAFLQNDPDKHQLSQKDKDALRCIFEKLNGFLERLKNKDVPQFSQNKINEILMNNLKCQNKLLNIQNEKLSRQNDEKKLIKQIHDLLIKQIGRLLSDLMIYSQRQERYRQIQFERDCLLEEGRKHKEKLAQKDRQIEDQKLQISQFKNERTYFFAKILNKQEQIFERFSEEGKKAEDSQIMIRQIQNTLINFPNLRIALNLRKSKSSSYRNSLLDLENTE